MADAGCPWDALPQPATLCVLHFLAHGHAKAARLVCCTWRDSLDGQATCATLLTWPGRCRRPSAGSDGAPAGDGEAVGPAIPPGTAGAFEGGAGAGPLRPLHVVCPNAAAVDLSPLLPDEAGGRMASLLGDLARLTGLTELTLSWSALAVRESSVANAATRRPGRRGGGGGGGGGGVNGGSGGGGGDGGDSGAWSADHVLSLSYGHKVQLPDHVSQLTGLRSLKILGPGTAAAGRDAAPLSAHPTAPPLPAALGALGEAGLASLEVEGLVLPRRQLAAFGGLTRLALRGWDAVTKMAVHLHKLKALCDLELAVDDTAPDPADAGHLLRSVLLEVSRASPLTRLCLRWGAADPAALGGGEWGGVLDQAVRAHAASLAVLETDVFASAASCAALGPLGCLAALRELRLWGAPRPGAGGDLDAGDELAGGDPHDSGASSGDDDSSSDSSDGGGGGGGEGSSSSRGAAYGSASRASDVAREISEAAAAEAMRSLELEPPPRASVPHAAARGAAVRQPAARLLPEGLARLTALEVAGLRGCDGSLELGAGDGLRRVVLQGCRSLRELPPDLADCRQLGSLEVQGSSLAELPDWLSRLTLLEELAVEGSRLAAAPAWLPVLSSLTRLALSGARLEAAPPEAAALPALRALDLSGNRLASVAGLANLQPAGCGGASVSASDSGGEGGAVGCGGPGAAVAGLWELDLGDVSMARPQDRAALLAWAPRLRWLKALRVPGCGLRALPEGLPGGLEELDVSRNQIAALPLGLSALVSLEALDASDNPLATLPPGVTRLHCLRELLVAGCSLQGLPEGMGAMASLEVLDASSNPRLAVLPPCLGAAPALRFLLLAGTAVAALPPGWAAGGTAAAKAGGHSSVHAAVLALTVPLPALALLALPPVVLRDDPAARALKARGVDVRAVAAAPGHGPG